MDGPTHGQIPLRFVSRLKREKTSPINFETNPRVERRRRLQAERRNEQLTNLWRIFLFSAIAYGLSLLVVKNGWSPISLSEIRVNGSQKIKSISIINASGLNFPKPLFSINPAQLERKLLKELPIKSIAIRRRLLPPRLEIEVKERKPIAFANRRITKGTEKGMLDELGQWMPMKMASKTSPPEKDIYVEGWVTSHRNWISIILKNQDKLGSPLRKITIKPNGEINLKTQDFEEIQLGNNGIYLREQISVLQKLSQKLPASFINQEGAILDITDPSKPEFQIPKAAFK
jgi:cell division protein FtsQ